MSPADLTDAQWQRREDYCNQAVQNVYVNNQRVPLPIDRIRSRPMSLEALQRQDPLWRPEEDDFPPGGAHTNQFSMPSLNDVKNQFLRHVIPQREAARDHGRGIEARPSPLGSMGRLLRFRGG